MNAHQRFTKLLATFLVARERLPNHSQYFLSQGITLKGRPDRWRAVRCHKHPNDEGFFDQLNLMPFGGRFWCGKCGVQGSDVLALHMWRNDIDVIQAAKDLGVWRPRILLDALKAAWPRRTTLPTLTETGEMTRTLVTGARLGAKEGRHD